VRHPLVPLANQRRLDRIERALKRLVSLRIILGLLLVGSVGNVARLVVRLVLSWVSKCG
jgi:hypothetical protein